MVARNQQGHCDMAVRGSGMHMPGKNSVVVDDEVHQYLGASKDCAREEL